MIERMRSEAHPNRDWKGLESAESSEHLKIPEDRQVLQLIPSPAAGSGSGTRHVRALVPGPHEKECP